VPVVNSHFGTNVTADDIVDTFGFFDSWEDRYKYLIDLGKELPPMDEASKTDNHLVRGCQSQVWIDTHRDGDAFWFDVDSDAFIVKGLLAVILAAYNGKPADEIRNFDIEGYFDELDLMRHLSGARGNGLKAMVERVRAEASK
jgi:cysteine desulfuration protein SufE